MTKKAQLLLFLTCFIGYSTSPSYSGDIISCDSFESCANDNTDAINKLIQTQAEMQAEIDALKALLAGVNRGVDLITLKDTLRFTNMNVQIVSGSGATAGATTGTGNLIIGYHESRGNTQCPDGLNCDRRSGSHMLVIGTRNNYASYGGMVVGNLNETSAPFASVSGGENNTASSRSASVSGGYYNTASAISASVSGGEGNEASGAYASVSGGDRKTAAAWSCVVGDNGVDC